MRKLLTLAAWLLISSAHAQAPVISTSTGSSITTTNTFQSIVSAATFPNVRHGCTVQNQGKNDMWIFLGSVSQASTPTALKLLANATFRCDAGPIVIQNELSITGTAADQFTVTVQ